MASLGDVIKGSHDRIVDAWTARVRQAAAARGLSRPELMNIMPKYLSWLGEMDGAPVAAGRHLLEAHLSTRVRQGFNLDEIQEEMAALGRCIVEASRAMGDAGALSTGELERLFGELHKASSTAGDVLTRHLLEDEQTEKRYFRELEQIARAALRKNVAPLRDRLGEILGLVIEAMGGVTAALRLQDPRTKALVTVASVGVGARALREYLTAVDPASFAGRAAAGELHLQPDADTTTMPVPEILQREGIGALVSVRLPPQEDLLGVLFLGSREERAFTARELHRLQALGDRMAVHIENAQLYDALGEKVAHLEAERELRERFMSVLAHDLRGPLASIKMNAQRMVRRPELLDARRDLARKIDADIDRADRMIRDLLDTHRIRAGRLLALHLEPCDLVAVARAVVEELTALHGGRFTLEGPREVRGIWSGDELRRALWNLATNAVKYGARAAPIVIRVGADDEEAELSVHNEGPALGAEDQVRLFEPFSRGRSAEITWARGWGLGLTLVRGCAEAHGGEVRVESVEGEGTTFTIRLPLDSRPFQSPPPRFLDDRWLGQGDGFTAHGPEGAPG